MNYEDGYDLSVAEQPMTPGVQLSYIRTKAAELLRLERARKKSAAKREPRDDYSLSKVNAVRLLLAWDVAEARQNGCPWQQIAEASGVSKPEALKRWEGVEDVLNPNNPDYLQLNGSRVCAMFKYPRLHFQHAATDQNV